MDLILIGIQGSGKGTQARILAEKYKYKIFETGGELRQLAKGNTPLGKKIKSIIERGDLVSNEIIMEIVENFLQNIQPQESVIFDGIPRSEEQRQSLEELLLRHNRDFLAIEIKLSEKEVMNRLLRRAEIEGRADDNPEAIQKRIQNFFTYTAPLLQSWKKRNKLQSVDGSKSIEAVSQDIQQILSH